LSERPTENAAIRRVDFAMAIQRLTPLQLLTLWAVVAMRLSYRQLAERMDVTPQCIKYRIGRCKSILQDGT